MLKRFWDRSTAFRETVRLALDTLRAHKLRSFLTLLGVILAVTTLVAVMSVVEGLNRYIADRVANLGSNVFFINKFGIITNHQEFLRALRRPPLRLEDYEALREAMQLAAQVAAGDDAVADVRYGNELLEDVALLGVTPNFLEVRGYGLATGRMLTQTDDERRSPVCVIANDLVQRFFPHVDPIGKPLRVGQYVYEVVGTLKPMGTVFGQSRDNFVVIPLGTYLKGWFRPGDSIFVLVQAVQQELMDAAADEARVILRARRHVPYKEPDNFGIVLPTSITGLWERLTGNIFAMAVGLTSVFMVVGGIVIMNIMLASVIERTREIGIRKSVGAKRRHIIMQFLVESAVLAAIGGIVGVLAAVGISALVRAVFEFPIVTSLQAVVVALALATSVGLFFGIYPAMRASRLDPIEAMRAET